MAIWKQNFSMKRMILKLIERNNNIRMFLKKKKRSFFLMNSFISVQCPPISCNKQNKFTRFLYTYVIIYILPCNKRIMINIFLISKIPSNFFFLSFFVNLYRSVHHCHFYVSKKLVHSLTLLS